MPDPATVGVRTAARHSTEVLTDWVGRFRDAFDTEFREWVAGLAAGEDPIGPSSWDGYAATVITAATVEALESGRVVATDLKPRPAFYGGAA
jgi:myo-inositol 2-dehydrogenase/D-chiro-inositol 1-dehydrogenase